MVIGMFQMHHRRAFFSLVAGLCTAPLAAQFRRVEGAKPRTGADGNATFRVDVDVVNLLATVRNQSGAIVNDLNKEDFLLLEDGVEREIRYFSRQTDLPLTMGILFDTSRSQVRVLEEQREAAYEFLGRVLRPEQDQAFIIKFDTDVELVQGLTSSRRLLEQAIGSLRVKGAAAQRPVVQTPMGNDFQIRIGLPGRRRPGMPGGRGTGGGNPPARTGSTGGTNLYDALYLAADDVLASEGGRKAILLISDGVDYGSRTSRSDAVETSQRADALVYSILYMDPRVYNRKQIRTRGTGTLQHLSSETGGGMFEVSDDLPIAEVFAQIEEELRNQYSLGFTPAPGAGNTLRPLDLQVRNKNLKVRTRKGYYAKSA